jgi:DNA-binding MarR family transcriptional regulator
MLLYMNLSNKSVPNFDTLAMISTYQSGVIQSRAYRRLKKEVSAYLKPHNLTMMEWFVVGFIYDAQAKGIRITELASSLQTTLPYITNVVNTLALKGFVTRGGAEDNRSKIIHLTPSARKACPIIEEDLRVSMRKLIYENIDPEDFKAYIKVLYQLANQKD